MSSAAVVIGALRVKVYGCIYIFFCHFWKGEQLFLFFLFSCLLLWTTNSLQTGVYSQMKQSASRVVVVVYVHGKHLRSCRDGQLT